MEMEDLIQAVADRDEGQCVHLGTMDRLELRLEIGKAVRAMQEAHHRTYNDQESKAESDRLHAKWRKLTDQANEARQELEDFQRMRAEHNYLEKKEVMRLQKKTPGLLLMRNEYLPHGEPSVIVCAITGLAIFEGDKIIGNEDYGFVALAGAIEPKAGIPSLGPDPRDME